ncbi:uncharacterized protein LOC134543219 [Bacillus rossius redtenbacheri]|uniref:uncharacterized protein LOC134543219 n=1 Tax=Bacillus rossius redtenbacheri TaxID=93214 RepID=UPI002FDE7DEC
MKKQGDDSLPVQPPHGQCSWWGGGTRDRLGKRHGAVLDPSVLSKLQRVGEGPCTNPHTNGTNADDSLALAVVEEGGDVGSGIRKPPESSFVPFNTESSSSDVWAGERVLEYGNADPIPSCDKLMEVSSEIKENATSLVPNGSVSPAVCPLATEMSVGQREDRDDSENALTSADIDPLCCDLDKKVPKFITNYEENFSLDENYGDLQSFDETCDAGDVKSVMLEGDYSGGARWGKQSARADSKTDACGRGFLEDCTEALDGGEDKGVENVEFDERRLLLNGNESLGPSGSVRCPFGTGMVPGERWLAGTEPCSEAGVVERLDGATSFRDEGVAAVAEPQEPERWRLDSPQEPGKPGLPQERGDVSDADDDSDNSDVPDDEIEAMLEEGLLRKPDKSEHMVQFNQREKIVLDELGHDHFDVLPEGWVKVTHNSGMPLYLHKASRVCNITKPYFLGPGSTRKHEIPLSAIPCLQYRRALEEERASSEKAAVMVGPGGIQLPNACIETAEENKARHSLSAEQVHHYCSKKFPTKTVTVARVKKAGGKKKPRDQKQISRPTLPEGTKLIKFPVENKWPVMNNTRKRKERILNPNGKSYVCILHEYVQHALKKQPSYIFKETDDPELPYSASVVIDQAQYGSGRGGSKKQAKSEAARRTLEILIPEMRDKIEADCRAGHCKASASCNTDLSIFDEIRIEDPRVAELTCRRCVCAWTGQKLHPHIKSWGSILRMYGSSSIRSLKDKKQEEQEITFLQSKAEENEPNYGHPAQAGGHHVQAGQRVQEHGEVHPSVGREALLRAPVADLNTVNM